MKYRHRILTGQTTVRSKEIIMEVCTANYVDIVRGNITPDHMLISISPSMMLSKLVKYIKEKSSHKLFKKFEHLRKRYWVQHLWQEDNSLLQLTI
ncbi:MAG: IS200/IS605 family transposase [Wolbachia sp.]|nr:IS200/IS605 family transposase [Wolbachia sp.]MDD9336240.1 IS200/IS605 family transposase [Wolbachia sp.]